MPALRRLVRKKVDWANGLKPDPTVSTTESALTIEKENELRNLDESVALKLKGQQICAELALEKEKVALQRTIQARSNGTQNQETTLQHKQQMCVFNSELKVKSHKRTLEIKEEIRQKSF
jgi:hypothetical protein